MVHTGYFYDENGTYTHADTLENRAVYKKRIEDQYVPEVKITEEKLCEFHTSIENGAYEPGENEEVPPKETCLHCVMYKEETVMVKKPVEVEDFIGYEPIVPENCTLEPCPPLIYDPVFRDGHWVKLKPDLPPQPPEEPTEMEKLKKQMELMQKALDELIMG
ncbi:hypothetical protein [Bacillus toyonensis]|uniref:hypothetical protein n=1 Tax=Bacillus toyonensis TaxID=155322 RepID=UPI002175E82D|nr:hypothetical protein [Bacillus toyonensis]